MKKYDRQKRKYVSESEFNGSLKKRKTCKGGKPHDYVELLPYGVKFNANYKHNVAPYREAVDKITTFEANTLKELELKHGIIAKPQTRWGHRVTRFACTVCKKTKAEINRNY